MDPSLALLLLFTLFAAFQIDDDDDDVEEETPDAADRDNGGLDRTSM